MARIVEAVDNPHVGVAWDVNNGWDEATVDEAYALSGAGGERARQGACPLASSSAGSSRGPGTRPAGSRPSWAAGPSPGPR